MRILIVSNLFPPDYDGGQEINAWKIARALRERGHHVEVATSVLRSGFQLEAPEPDWVHRILKFVPHIPDKRSGKAARFEIMKKLADRIIVGAPNAQAMENLLDRKSFDLVYCFGLHGVSLATAFPPTRRQIPILWHVGDHFIADHFAQVNISRLYRAVLTVLLRPWFGKEKAVDFSHMAFVSQFLLDYFREKGFDPVHPYVVPRGIDFPLGEDIDRERLSPANFFMACRLDSTKGVHIAIEATSRLAIRRPELDWTLDIAGGGIEEYKQQLIETIAGHGLGSRVKFVGKLSREETLKRIRTARAFISSSLWGEPFANTIIETLGSGTPLIGAETGSILEVVVPNQSALIYQKDDPEALSLHLEAVLTDDSLCRRIATGGLEVIRARYTLERIMELTEKVFAEVIADRG